MSNTKIELEYPYSQDWKRGYLTQRQSGKDKGRRNVSLVGFNNERSSVSYARYLMSVHLGRYLNLSEHVDHINSDKSDDRIENFQILSPGENMMKERETAKMVKLICYFCGIEFTRLRKHTTHKPKNNNVYCSRKCMSEAFKK